MGCTCYRRGDLQIRQRQKPVCTRGCHWNQSSENVGSCRGRSLESEGDRLLRVRDIDQRGRGDRETRDSHRCAGTRAELQLIGFGGVGMWVADVNVVDQADVIAPLLCRERNGIRAVDENAARDSKTRPSLLLVREVDISERVAVEGNRDLMLLGIGHTLEYHIDNRLPLGKVRDVQGL